MHFPTTSHSKAATFPWNLSHPKDKQTFREALQHVVGRLSISEDDMTFGLERLFKTRAMNKRERMRIGCISTAIRWATLAKPCRISTEMKLSLL